MIVLLEASLLPPFPLFFENKVPFHHNDTALKFESLQVQFCDRKFKLKFQSVKHFRCMKVIKNGSVLNLLKLLWRTRIVNALNWTSLKVSPYLHLYLYINVYVCVYVIKLSRYPWESRARNFCNNNYNYCSVVVILLAIIYWSLCSR